MLRVRTATLPPLSPHARCPLKSSPAVLLLPRLHEMSVLKRHHHHWQREMSSGGQINETTGLSLNRSQYGGCSTKYDTPTQTQVVYKGFGTPTLSIKLLVVKHGTALLRTHQRASVLWWLDHAGRDAASGVQSSPYRCLPTPGH